MPPSPNVRPFPGSKPGSDWIFRILAALFYGFLAWVMRQSGEGSLTLLMVLALLYWAFVHQKRQATPYFFRYHLLQAMILFLFLMLAFRILQGASMLLYAAMNLLQLGGVLAGPIGWVTGMLALIEPGVFLGMAVWMGIAALMGKTPSIRFVSENVRHWA